MENAPIRIVLLGGGYVTVWAYRSLAKRLRAQLADGRVQITVVCPNEHHVFHGWTAESLTDTIHYKNRHSPLVELLPKATLLFGTAEEVDLAANQVYIKEKDDSRRAIPYDQLVLGIGSYDNDSIEGIRRFGYTIKLPEEFARTRQTLHRLVAQAAEADPETARRLLSFTVAGGGFAGVEIATNLAEYINLIKQQYPSLRPINHQIRLINRGERILSELHPRFERLIRYAEKTMQQYGIEVLNASQLVHVTENGAVLADGSVIESRMVISTVGQSRLVLKGTESIPRDSLGRVYATTYQQLNGQTNVWGGGDACHIKHFQTGEPCPTNALWAIKHGEYVGRNIARALKGKPLKPFTFRGLGQAASLGIGKGMSELYGIQITGPLSWIMRWFFFHYFMPSRKIMLKSVSDWLFLLVRGQRKGLHGRAGCNGLIMPEKLPLKPA